MNIDELRVHTEWILGEVSQHPTVQKLKDIFPEVAPENLCAAFGVVLEKEGRRLLKHVVSLSLRAKQLSKKFHLSNEDLRTVLVGIMYHDFTKVIEHLGITDNSLLDKVLRTDLGHSLSASRLFLYLDDPQLARTVRHNSTDYVLDLAQGNLTIHQILLNLVDKTDHSGEEVSIQEKYQIIRGKIGDVEGYDDVSEQIACNHLAKVLSSVDNPEASQYPIDKEKANPTKTLFIQRFDGKYCAPIGVFSDTSSNLKITSLLGKWEYDNLILHEGNFQEFPYPSVEVRGILPTAIDYLLPEIASAHDLLIVEGTTTRLEQMAKYIGTNIPKVLLLRTLVDGEFTPERLKKSLCADEVWVMTEDMKRTLERQYSLLSVEAVPEVRVLQSGLDDVFCVDSRKERQAGKIVYVGALASLKGIDVMIEAFNDIHHRFPHTELHIIGSPEIYGRANAFDMSSLEAPGIVYHGVLSAEKIAEQLQTAHFAVLLTKKYETFGKSAMQARACGTKMIVSGNGGLPLHVCGPDEGIVLADVTVPLVQEAAYTLLKEKPESHEPPRGRYHPWNITALNFHSYVQLLKRKILQKNQVSLSK